MSILHFKKCLFYFVLVLLFFSACTNIRRSPKYELADGIYNSNLRTKSSNKVYLEIHGDTIQAFATTKDGHTVLRNQTLSIFPETEKDSIPKNYTFYKPSLDIDFITILFKYRPVSQNFPRQLNTSLGGALYLGSRYDLYRISYKPTPLNFKEREINHFGFSLGLFGGIGSTFMNPWVTNYAIDAEYDGVVFLKGIAGLLAINNFTAGLAIGSDTLLDPNHKLWIYQNKLWVGLIFTLNLN